MLKPVSSRPEVPPAYGIAPPEGGRGLLDWSWADERLQGRHIWWLSSVRPDGRPHQMPVWAVWMPDDGVAFSTNDASRKAKNIEANPNVSIAPERGVQSVIVEGVVSPMPSDRLADFFALYLTTWATDVEAMGEPVFLIRPTKAFGFIDEDDGFPLSATRWSF